MSKKSNSNKALWITAAFFVVVIVTVPKIVEFLTGQYQNSSFQTDVNSCTRGMQWNAKPEEVTNICNHEIVVGMCLTHEVNPMPCKQTAVIKPGEFAIFDTKGQSLSSLPSYPNGLTVVACKPGDRPSRTLNVGGKGYRGVCLPPK